VIVAELFAGSQGIGYLISYAGQMFQTDTLLVGVACVAGTGMALNLVAERVQRRFERWRPAHVGGR
jgi:NitT/TauT family transport system permease protein